ncbi:MAG TPA: DNA methyltransferase, partial [Candidatus Limnocylindria bacterium]|nr:DNA methyltransferase [Candidatus Limnocylindria bacterium]
MNALSVKRVPIESVHPDPANVRLHDARNLEAIKGSLARFGQQKPIVVDKHGTIRAGNGTYAAARALGWTEIDIVESELEGVEATAYSIADNRTSDLSSFDEPALAKLLEELQAEDALDGVGYSDEDLSALIAGLTNEVPEVLEDAVPGLPDAAVTRLGDVWVLGPHRLMCGDSASVDDVDRLLGGAAIHLVNTDPPYNVKVEPRSNNAIAAGLSSFTTTHHQGLDLARHPGKAQPTHEKLRPKDRPLANDFLPEEEFDRLLRAWFGNVARVLLPGRAFYVWGGYGNLGNYPPALRESELYFSQAIVWDKQHPVLTRKDFMGAFEIAYYGWREGAAHVFFGPANVPDLWQVKKLNHTAMSHLTEKPVELAARAIAYSSREGENVLDLFGGSGSTMAACAQTGRN